MIKRDSSEARLEAISKSFNGVPDFLPLIVAFAGVLLYGGIEGEDAMRESELSMENETFPVLDRAGDDAVGEPKVARPMSDVALFLTFFFLLCFASCLFWIERVIILSLHLSKVSCSSLMVCIATWRFSSATAVSVGRLLEGIVVVRDAEVGEAVTVGAATSFGAKVGETCDFVKLCGCARSEGEDTENVVGGAGNGKGGVNASAEVDFEVSDSELEEVAELELSDSNSSTKGESSLDDGKKNDDGDIAWSDFDGCFS